MEIKVKHKDYDLTDENLGDELDALREAFHPLNSDNYQIYSSLPEGFTSHFYSEIDSVAWHRDGFFKHDKNGSVSQILCGGAIAVEFKNGFLSVSYEEAL